MIDEVKTNIIYDQEYLKNSKKIVESIRNLLDQNNINYQFLEHEPMGASKEVAKLRSGELKNGGKAMLIKINGSFKLFVLSAAYKISLKKIQIEFKTKKVQFSNGDELKNITGLVPGCIPPFGEPILPLELFIDPTIVKNEIIEFNAGSLTNSIKMNVSDYLKVSNGKILEFSEETSII